MSQSQKYVDSERKPGGILYGFIDTDTRVAWKCYHQGRTEYFPACPTERAIRTAEHVLGVPVEVSDSPLSRLAGGER